MDKWLKRSKGRQNSVTSGPRNVLGRPMSVLGVPMSLTLEDYAATEKISNLPRKLSTEGAPAGSDPSIGDIAYYSPWGNLAIFYRDFRYSSGLIKLGKIDSGIEALNVRMQMC